LRAKSRKVLGFILLGCVALVALALPWWLDRDPPPLSDLTSSMGTDELRQILGGPEDESHTTTPIVAHDSESIRGQVVRPGGEPAPGALVVLHHMVEDLTYEVEADQGGLFRIGPVAPGRYFVEATKEGYGPAVAQDIAPGSSPLRLVLHGGREIRGIVLQGNEPVPRAVVHLGGPGLFPQRMVVADGTGQYRFSGLRPGHYHLVAVAPGAGSGFGARVHLDESEGTEPIRLDLAIAAAPPLQLRIVDRQSGEPVEFGVATVSERSLYVIALQTPFDFGQVIVDYLPRGEYWLRVRAPGYLPYEGRLRVSGSSNDIRVALTRGSTIQGTVRDEAGNGIGRVQLSVHVVTPTGARWELRRSIFDEFHRLVRPDGTPFWMQSVGFNTERSGRYSLAGIPAGTVVVTATAPGFAPAVSAPLTVQTDTVYENIDLVLRRSRTVRGRVEHAGGGGVSDATVSMRPSGVPGWAAARSVTTDTFGVFVLEDVGPSLDLVVRHPDYGALEVSLDVPPDGLDDVIIRLAGTELPQVVGRLYLPNGSPAVGARVWIMAGQSDLPVCRSIVGPDAWFRATHCSATPERLIASHGAAAPLRVDLGGDLEPRDWHLRAGGEIELISQRTPVLVTVEPRFQLPSAHWPRPEVDLDRWSRHRVSRVAPGQYRVSCMSEGHATETFNITVEQGRRVDAPCPHLERTTQFPIFVTDPQGAPVRNALVFVDGVRPRIRKFTDARGRIQIEADPGLWLTAEALHEDWGRGNLTFYVPHQEPSEPFRIPLEVGIAGSDPAGFVEQLEDWGVIAVVDGRSVVVDRSIPGTPAAAVGLRRLDRLLWARPISEFRFSVGVRRAGEVLTFDLIRELPSAQ